MNVAATTTEDGVEVRADARSPRRTADAAAVVAALAVVGLLAGGGWSLVHRVVGLPGGGLIGDLLVAVAVGALALLARSGVPPADRVGRALALDASIMAGATLVVVWLLAGRAVVDGSGADAAGVVAVVAPAVAAGVLTVALATTGRGRAGARISCAPGNVALAVGLVLVGDVARLAWRAATVPDAVSVFAVCAWTLAALVVASGGRVGHLEAPAARWSQWLRRGGIAISNTTERRARGRVERALPAAPVIAAATAAVAGSLDALVLDRIDPVVAAGLTISIALVLVRQRLALVDNDRMEVRLRQKVDELERQARHDPLTGLPNRAGLEERIRAAQRRASDRGASAAVLFIDLDHLKTVNDTLGHSAGDALITTIAQRFVARVGEVVTRFGGDEFVIVLDDVPAADAAAALATSLVGDASRPTRLQGQDVRPSVSIGVAVDHGLTPDELLRRADVALYRAKSNGRQRVETAGAGDDAHRRRLQLRHELRTALEEGQFRVHYQPMAELATGRVVGAESLLRWEHPERGVLSPGAFLDEAIAAGLLPAIGAATVSTVVADLTQTLLPVSVNLSTSELLDASLVGRLAAELGQHSVDPTRLTVEITEDVVVDRAVQRAIEGLRSLGVGLAIDDFGTGNSSLRQLGSYPAEVLKIDRSFVERIAESHEALAVTRAIVRMAHDLGLRTVAEGVETTDQATVLVELGCELAQGWLFARPMTITQLVAHHPPGVRLWTPYPTRPRSVASASSSNRSSSSATGGRSSIAPTT